MPTKTIKRDSAVRDRKTLSAKIQFYVFTS